jgi:glycosyltransferase involved in cell wall biosynthesis
MKISIVMPTHNRADALPVTLEALNQQTFPKDGFEVIIVDQASTDGSREIATSFSVQYPLRLLPQDGKYGISIARNAGIEAANGFLIILLDADIIADPGLVEAHCQLHNRFSIPILGCGRLLPYPPCYRTFIDQVANPDAGLDRGTEPEDFPFYYAFGGHLSFSKDTFTRVGPFDPELKGAEDTEFAYRASLINIAIKNCYQAIGYHNHARSLEERRERGFAYSKMIPRLMKLHPELRGAIPGVYELEPFNWRHDPLPISYAKLRAEFWSWKINRNLLYRLLVFCERERTLPRFVKAGYYRLLLGDMRAGANQQIS